MESTETTGSILLQEALGGTELLLLRAAQCIRECRPFGYPDQVPGMHRVKGFHAFRCEHGRYFVYGSEQQWRPCYSVAEWEAREK